MIEMGCHSTLLSPTGSDQNQCNVPLLRAYPMGHSRSEPRTKTAHASDQTAPCLGPNPHASDQHASDQCSMPRSNVPRSNGPKFPRSASAQKAHPCPIVLWHIIPCYHCLHYPILAHCSSLLLFAYYYI